MYEAGCPPNFLAPVNRRYGHDWQHGETKQRQTPVDGEHGDDDANQRNHVAGDHDDTGRKQFGERLDVVGHTRDDLPDRGGVEEAHILFQNVLEQDLPQIDQRVLTDGLQQVSMGKAQDEDDDD